MSALANSPGVLDFYIWIAWTPFNVEAETAGIKPG